MSKVSRRDRTPSESPFSPARGWGLLVGWGAISLVYVLVFYATPLSQSPGEKPLPRGVVLLTAFTPEYFWQTWTGNGKMAVGILDRLPIVMASGFLLTLAGGLGWGTLELLGLAKRMSRLEALVFSCGGGLNLLALLTLAIGLTGRTEPPVSWVAPSAGIAGAIVALAVWRRRKRKVRATNAPLEPAAPRDSAGAWLAAGIPFVAVILFGAMLPPYDFDVREYHLQVPKEWFQRGQIDFLSHNVYGNMPLGAEVLSLPAMALMPGERDWWWGALVGKTLMACFAPLTALALFAAGRRFISPLAGAAAALVYISIPWVAGNAMAGLNDHVLGCYVFLAFFAILLWRRDPASSRLLWLAGFFAGAAAGCKYTGVLYAVAPLGAFAAVAAFRGNSNRQAGRESVSGRMQRAAPIVAAFTLAATCGGGLWYAKNAALAGNPVYPLLYGVFEGRTRTPEKAAQWSRAHQVPRSEADGPYSLRRLAQSVAAVTWRSDWLSPLLVPLIILAPWGARRGGVVGGTALLLLFLLAAWWLFTHRIDRFWIPALPFASLLAGAGGAWLAERAGRKLVWAIVIGGLVSNLLVAASWYLGDNRFFVSLEALRHDVGDPEAGEPGLLSPAHDFLNRSVPPDGAVLLVGDAQPFDLEVATYYNTCFDNCLFEQWMNDRSLAKQREALLSRGITHVLVDWGEIARYQAPGNYGFTEYVQPAVFEELEREGLLREVWPDEVGRGVELGTQVYEVVQ